MKHLSILLVLLLATVGNTLMAQEVSVDMAESRVLDFLSNNTHAARRAKSHDTPLPLSLAYTSRSENKTCFYVFNVGEDEGFVIAGGDEAAREILGFCDHGSFDYDTAPENFKWWLGEYTQQIAHAELQADGAAAASAPRRAKAAEERVSIGPLIKTKWSQSYPYNSEIPVYSSDGRRYVTGCLATAMAQVMKFWGHPAQGQGSHSFSWEGNTFSADFGSTTYDWDNMLLSYSNEYTQEQAKAVGTLMYHVGVSVDMKYSTSGSAAHLTSAIQALLEYFNYNKSIRYENRFYYDDEEWEELVYNELKNGRPVLYCGYSPWAKSSHAFVCDGYDADKNLYSINWGWGGTANGSYLLSGENALNSFWQGCFNEQHYIACNIMPAEMSTNEPYPNIFSSGSLYNMVIDGKNYYENYNYDHLAGRLDNCFLFCAGLQNLSSSAVEYDFGVKAEEINTGITHYWTSMEHVTLGFEEVAGHINLPFDPFDLDNGKYELFPVYRLASHSDEEWIEAGGVNRYPRIPTITVTGQHFVDFTLGRISLSPNGTLQISWPDDYEGTPTFSSSNPEVAIVDENGLIAGLNYGVTTIFANADATPYYAQTEYPFEIWVTDGDFVFTEQPYYNNDDNPSANNAVLHCRIKNVGDKDVLSVINYICVKEGGPWRTYLRTTEIKKGEEKPFEFDMSYFFNYFFKNYTFDESYLLYFYLDTNCSIPWNYPSVSFTYRDKLTVDYNVGSSGYGTLILPFNQKLPEGWKVYGCSGVDENGVLTMVEDESIRRNVPYIVQATPESAYQFVGPKAIDADKPSFTNGILVGAVADNVPLNAGTDYLLQEQNGRTAFFKYTGTPSDDPSENDNKGNRLAKPFRAFLRLDAADRAKLFLPGQMDDETEGIKAIGDDNTCPASIYSIDGKRHASLQKGLNLIILHDGKVQKVYVK